MERRDLVDLLYSAYSRFKSIQLSWTYTYDEAVLRPLLEDPNTQVLKRVVSSSSDVSDQLQAGAIVTIRRRVWWQRPGCWREEQRDPENEQSATIICDGQSWQYSTKYKILFTNTGGTQDQSFAGYEIQRTSLTPLIEYVSEHIQLLDPSFLLTSHALEVVGETLHAGRAGVEVRGKYLKHRELLFEDFFWATADAYMFVVDREYGILLRYAYLQNGHEIAVSSVDDVTFDQPIPAEVFSPGPVTDA